MSWYVYVLVITVFFDGLLLILAAVTLYKLGRYMRVYRKHGVPGYKVIFLQACVLMYLAAAAAPALLGPMLGIPVAVLLVLLGSQRGTDLGDSMSGRNQGAEDEQKIASDAHELAYNTSLLGVLTIGPILGSVLLRHLA
jgi:hypothetical protein